MASESLRFIKVQDFFSDSYSEAWHRLKGATNIKYNTKQKQLEISFVNADGNPCVLLLSFLSENIIRKRFHPGRASASDYPLGNKRSVVMDGIDMLASTFDDFDVKYGRTTTGATVKTSAGGKDCLTLDIQQNPFRIRVSKYAADGTCYPVLSDWEQPLRYRKRSIEGVTDEEYSIIQSFAKPAAAKYIGFGEKGGLSQIKNMTQLSYFNYDNMRYKQIYNQGPLCDSEPLYHTDPFFLEFGGSPLNVSSCYGIFVDNGSETFVDVGFTDTQCYEFGSLYGELDFYTFFGNNSIEVMEGHSQVIGHARLKPRYALGYHQGCYGYDDREKVIQAALHHRHNNIPLDGVHIDVDIQHKYQTFTINDERYGNPQAPFSDPIGMFGYLKSLGVKCSTNITPIVSNLNLWDAVPYKTYHVAKVNDLLVNENRNSHEIGQYQNFGDGHEWWARGYLDDVHTGQPYVGEVYYGGGRGTSGSYFDLGKSAARLLWGEQYRFLYDMGLEMVWQDMTTPAIRDNRGDMKSFPYALHVTDNFLRKYDGETDAVKANQVDDPTSPAGTIRNLYSYNLHKATYHGLNNLGTVTPYSLLPIDENNLHLEDAEKILSKLKTAGYLKSINQSKKAYKVVNSKDLSDGVQLPLANQYQQYNQAILDVLRLCKRLEEKRGNTRNFIVGRGGFTGMHRFAALWTGDNASTWDFLKMNVAQVLALGISGQPLSGQDIGGFEQGPGGGKWIDPELLIRWTQVGAFLPWFRNHYIAKGVKDFQEVYAFQNVIEQISQDYRYMYEAVLPVCRHYIGLRYRLMQVFYDAMFENTLKGLPISRPMFLARQTDGALFNDKQTFLDSQFLVRNDVLVAPILFKQSGPNSGVRDIYLPAGSDWFCYKDNRQPLSGRVGGGMTFYNFDASISTDGGHIPFTAPVFIRSGAIIPTLEQEQFVGEYHSRGQLNPITLNIYPGASGEYTMYLDDGISRSSAPQRPAEEGGDPMAKGEYREVYINHHYDQQGQRVINIKRVHDKFDPMAGLGGGEHYFYIAILHEPDEAQNPLSGMKLSEGDEFQEITGGSPEGRAARLADATGNSWYYNENINISFAKYIDNRASASILVEYKNAVSNVVAISRGRAA